MMTFKGKVGTEGTKGYLTIGIPGACGIAAPGWFRLILAGYPPCFLYARKEIGCYSRTSLPVWNFAGLKIGDVVDARAEPAEPFRASSARVGYFDWNAFVENDERTFATEEANGVLKLWSRYSAPFELLRCPPVESLYHVLGFYQAEGSKGATGNDFSFANMNVELIRNAIENLNAIGIGANQLYAEILQGVGESRESAMAKYESLPLEVVAVRPRSGKGGSAYVVHAHNSKPFRGMVNRALAYIFANEFPSREAAKAFAFSWMDGDGSITKTIVWTKLRLAGLPDEHVVVKRALAQIFNWDLSVKNTEYKNNKEGSAIQLRADQIADLLDADAFPFSMNRVRLLLGLDERARKLADGRRAGAFSRWGLALKNGELTSLGNRVVVAYRRYADEIEKARRLLTASPELFGVKGTPLPSQFRLGIP